MKVYFNSLNQNKNNNINFAGATERESLQIATENIILIMKKPFTDSFKSSLVKQYEEDFQALRNAVWDLSAKGEPEDVEFAETILSLFNKNFEKFQAIKPSKDWVETTENIKYYAQMVKNSIGSFLDNMKKETLVAVQEEEKKKNYIFPKTITKKKSKSSDKQWCSTSPILRFISVKSKENGLKEIDRMSNAYILRTGKTLYSQQEMHSAFKVKDIANRFLMGLNKVDNNEIEYVIPEFISLGDSCLKSSRFKMAEIAYTNALKIMEGISGGAKGIKEQTETNAEFKKTVKNLITKLRETYLHELSIVPKGSEESEKIKKQLDSLRKYN